MSNATTDILSACILDLEHKMEIHKLSKEIDEIEASIIYGEDNAIEENSKEVAHLTKKLTYLFKIIKIFKKIYE